MGLSLNNFNAKIEIQLTGLHKKFCPHAKEHFTSSIHTAISHILKTNNTLMTEAVQAILSESILNKMQCQNFKEGIHVNQCISKFRG